MLDWRIHRCVRMAKSTSAATTIRLCTRTLWRGKFASDRHAYFRSGQKLDYQGKIYTISGLVDLTLAATIIHNKF